MIDCLAAVTIPILFGAIAFLIRKLTGKGSSQSNRTIICVSLVQAAGYGIAALILQLFSNLNLWTGTVIPLAVLIPACAVTTFAVSFSDLLHSDRASRFLKISGPLHLQPVFRGVRCHGGAVAESLFARGICLPSGTGMTPKDLARVLREMA